MIAFSSSQEILESLTQELIRRKPINGGDPESSYVARLLAKGPDSFLKKIGEEACEVVMAAKDVDHHAGDKQNLVGEVADLWFHCMVALTHYDLTAMDVVNELTRRMGTSGLQEKAMRKIKVREQEDSSSI